MSKKSKEFEVIKVEVPAWLAEKFRNYVARKYGLRRGSLSKALINLMIRELGIDEHSHEGIDSIVGLGLKSDYLWNGEDLQEALRRKTLHVSD